ncbi:hypothetical protein BN946_scf184844.g56 [Trametes cinnabarina]|uniref:DUF6533 domain-containing protein n=1 Tax=Pycnoporus cinnabarinus TaxID=5643 RepID=A0A060S962_PYCCI|nr:hypothetical protein BN946_scf184844.g56 [Trametes cinnabarina]
MADSDSNQENQELITALHLFTTSNMCEIVGITLLAYDHLLTLSGEIHFVWDRKFSGATVVFMLNRYVNLFSKIVLPISTFWWPSQTNKYHYIRSVPATLPYPFLELAINAVLSLQAAIAVDLLVLVLTWMKTYEIQKLASGLRSNATFSTLILRDGTLYFGTMLALNVADLIVLRSNVLFDPLPVFIDVFTCILISRFMLNLRQVSERGTGNLSTALSTDAMSPGSTVHFASNLVGDLGSPLVHAEWKSTLHAQNIGSFGQSESADYDAAYPHAHIDLESTAEALAPGLILQAGPSSTLGGAGIAAFDRQQQSQRSFAELSSEISQAQVDLLHAQLAQFRSALAHYASTHRDRIRKEPSFRHAFQQMCTTIGVDPLAGPRKGGWWAEMLGLGDWQYELGVQIVDVCVSTRERNGGLIEMSELIRLVSKLRGVGGDVITEDDVMRSIKTLKPLNAGYEVIDVGGGKKMIRSVPKQLDSDQTVVLAVAQEDGGRVSEATLVSRRGWTQERARAALANMLLRDGLCWLDEQDELYGVSYWVPSAMRWDE